MIGEPSPERVIGVLICGKRLSERAMSAKASPASSRATISSTASDSASAVAPRRSRGDLVADLVQRLVACRLDRLEVDEDVVVGADGDGRRQAILLGAEHRAGDAAAKVGGDRRNARQLGAGARHRHLVHGQAEAFGDLAEGLEGRPQLLDLVEDVGIAVARRRQPKRPLDLAAHVLERGLAAGLDGGDGHDALPADTGDDGEVAGLREPEGRLRQGRVGDLVARERAEVRHRNPGLADQHVELPAGGAVALEPALLGSVASGA